VLTITLTGVAPTGIVAFAVSMSETAFSRPAEANVMLCRLRMGRLRWGH